MQSYDTLSEALDGLRKQGFTLDYNLAHDRLKCREGDLELHPEDFNIVDVYRFEGETNPSDESVLYAVESKDGQRGTLVDAYGPYSEAISSEMAEKLTIRQSE
ncbi:phosphoribosylpyrophosphate synthetase [Spirosoma sp. SC4-14]|uniref:phosphoribosylpyrophosphate synthetase n=1 Tax=Spirosoma sp. SC4-14 TaxID=3128900 RepID=UPI0030D3A513